MRSPVPMIDYESHDALGLAALVARGDVTPRDLVDTAIDRIERRNGRLNAVVYPMVDLARRAADGPLPDGPFRGVPLLLKDLMCAYRGTPLGNGSRFFREHISQAHSEYVSRLVNAGFIVIGKTNTPELGILPTTEPEANGPTRNPWDTTRTPGGSSGGSGAAVAAGMVPVATGGDGGGSIRIPASCCGLFGLKPSRGRNPAGPVDGETWEGFVCEHVLTRTVRDSAAVLDVTWGTDTGAPHASPPAERSFAAEVDASPRRLRIAVTRVPLLSKNLHHDCVTAVDDAVELLEGLGHEVVDAAPRLDAAAFRRAMVCMLSGQVAADVRDAERALRRTATHRDFEAGTWAMRAIGEALSAAEYQQSVRDLRRAARSLAQFSSGYDVWLTPTLGAPPPLVGALRPKGLVAFGQQAIGRFELGKLALLSDTLDMVAEDLFSFIPFTPLANATGEPAMSVPLHRNAAGLPIGVHFTARFGDEATLFRLAAELERARPWNRVAVPEA